jgi:hypothetical protein
VTVTSFPGPGDATRSVPGRRPPAAHTARSARPPSPELAAVARLAAFLDRHPGWSAFYDKRYGLWRTAEDDPASVLYAETSDPDTIIAYITSHA